jgi:hypothetical protein
MVGVKGSWARVSLTNAATGVDGKIRHLRLYYVGGVSRRGPRTT